MSLSKSEFFFSKNSSVLSTLLKSRVPRASIFKSALSQNLRKSVQTPRTKINPWQFTKTLGKRNYSQTANVQRSKWPLNSDKKVGYLCIGMSGLVFGIVVLGGLTRLTESGLSITEWKPVTGSIPPLNQKDWEEEFSKYKESPEFKQLNSHITLEEFKFIFFMEWSHRLLGRIIGVGFVIPSLYFIARKRVSSGDAVKLLGICSMIGFQGFIGWWMVSSGLDEEDLAARRSKPTVSQYRLTTHLAVAFGIYSAMIFTGLQVLRNYHIMKAPEKMASMFRMLNSPHIRSFRRLSWSLYGLMFLTACSGGLVAGLDAGLIYNTFPHMGEDQWLPAYTELFSPIFSRAKDQADLVWRNMLDNPATVQLNHRILATATFLAVTGLHVYSLRIKPLVPKAAFKSLAISMGIVSAQVTLGICTLLWLVPTELATAHQAGALAVLTSVLVLCQQLKRPTIGNMMLLKKFLAEHLKNQKRL